MGQEQLLYKQIDFTMGQFCGFVYGMVMAVQELITGLLYQPNYQQ
jgi:hypothetical protein